MMMALYPRITSTFSSQGKGITCPESSSFLFCISTYQSTTDTKKQRLQKTVILEKKRKILIGLSIQYQASSTQHLVSSIQYPASSIQPPASSIQIDPESAFRYPFLP